MSSVKKYKIVEKDERYLVKEVDTDKIIRNFRHKKSAKELSNFLNGGGGFNGWTPDFILK